MLAISALSLSRLGKDHNLDAPQYYHRALASVQTDFSGDDDLLSDEVLLTHFLLLVYQVRAEEYCLFFRLPVRKMLTFCYSGCGG